MGKERNMDVYLYVSKDLVLHRQEEEDEEKTSY
jgi:hypothetical protein